MACYLLTATQYVILFGLLWIGCSSSSYEYKLFICVQFEVSNLQFNWSIVNGYGFFHKWVFYTVFPYGKDCLRRLRTLDSWYPTQYSELWSKKVGSLNISVTFNITAWLNRMANIFANFTTSRVAIPSTKIIFQCQYRMQ